MHNFSVMDGREGGSRAAHWVYILASRRNGALFVGVTGDLERRVHEHRCGRGAAFTREHRATRLVYAQHLETAALAAAQKKRIERWPRSWMLRLVDRHNPGWRDFYSELKTPPSP